MRGTWNRCGYSAESLSSTFDPDPFHLISDMMPGAFRTWITPCNVPNICRNLMKLTLTDKSDKSSKKHEAAAWSEPSAWIDSWRAIQGLVATDRSESLKWLTTARNDLKDLSIKKQVSSQIENPWLRSSCLVEFLWVGQMDGFNWLNWWLDGWEKIEKEIWFSLHQVCQVNLF